MYSYRIRGDNYDTIIVDVYFRGCTFAATQYYSNLGTIIGKDDVSYIVSMNNNLLCLDKIVTEAIDTVVLPASTIRCVSAYALEGTHFRRLVLPLDVQLRLKTHAFYGSDSLQEFISLSRKVIYEEDVFPSTVQRRIV